MTTEDNTYFKIPYLQQLSSLDKKQKINFQFESLDQFYDVNNGIEWVISTGKLMQ